MDSLLLIIKDSIPPYVLKVVDSAQPIAQEAPTNVYDVLIVVAICVAIGYVARIAKCGLLSWKESIIKAEKDERDDKKARENEEAERKQKSDIINKLLDFLKEKASEKTSNDGSDAQKSSDIYKDVLCFLIAHFEKDNLDDKGLGDLKKSCGLKENPPTQ